MHLTVLWLKLIFLPGNIGKVDKNKMGKRTRDINRLSLKEKIKN